MTAIVHRSMPDGVEWFGRMTRMSPAALHAVGCALAFAVVMVGGIHLMSAVDGSGLARSRALLATAQIRAADAQRLLAAAAARRPRAAVVRYGHACPARRQFAACARVARADAGAG